MSSEHVRMRAFTGLVRISYNRLSARCPSDVSPHTPVPLGPELELPAEQTGLPPPPQNARLSDGWVLRVAARRDWRLLARSSLIVVPPVPGPARGPRRASGTDAG
ncbi:hypothetical protein NUW54_g14002 [Trametes sanguinea]|uniref:Uncharacterized protein n=1 Tax=Trametes sanguinea TaxID=158606 RepID=A0ACC1MHP3_9APHY|nr:hypothetical protein NUW54_g14002 [Trametes sanguinea]